jgi:hypothetical protein
MLTTLAAASFFLPILGTIIYLVARPAEAA